MSHEEARAIVLRCLEDIAPGTGGDQLEPDDDMRSALDLDSLDIFNLVAAIAGETGVDIPDREVARLRTIDAFAARIAGAHVAG